MRVLTYTEAAARAGIVRRTLERLISVGEGPAIVEISSRRRGVIDVDLETWLLKRRRPPPGEAAESWAVPLGTARSDPQFAEVAQPPREAATGPRRTRPSPASTGDKAEAPGREAANSASVSAK